MMRRSPMGVAITMFISIAMVKTSHAEQIFNTEFLTDDLTNSQLSDLSRFEQSTHQLPGIYRVDVYVNNQYVFTRDINFIEKPEAQDQSGLFPCFDAKTLQSFGIDIEKFDLSASVTPQCIDFTSIIEGANSQFQFDKQKLFISLPQASLSNQVRGYIPPEQWDEGINGLFINYALSGYNNAGTDSNSAFLRLDNGFNIGAWQFRHSGSWSYNNYKGKTSEQWNDLDTYLQTIVVPIKSQLVIGDSSTNSEIFDSFGYRGIHLSTSDSMYPDSQLGYAPSIRGVAKTNAKVTIQQNGYTIHQVNVAPGPFLIQDLNPSSINGDLIVNIEENDGAVQTFKVPYSSLPILQREGRTKYSIAMGEYRTGLATQDNPLIAQVTAIHGLKKGISVYGGTQLSKNYKSFLLGMGANLGDFGALSFDITHANSELADQTRSKGQSLRFLYSKSLLGSGTTFQLLGYRYSTKGFYTLNDVLNKSINDEHGESTQDQSVGTLPHIADYYDLNNTKKGKFEANISHSFGKYGSLFVSANQQTYWNTAKKNEWVQAGYSNSWKSMNYSLSVSYNNYSESQQNDTIYAMNMSFPLDRVLAKAKFKENTLGNSYATFSSTQNSNGEEAYMAGMNGTLLKDRNLSYSINYGQNHQQGDIGSLSVTYNGSYGRVGAAYSYEKDSNQFSYNASGGILAHADGITFGQPLGTTSILVKAPGAKGVHLENYTGVKTDWRGYAIMPYATEYRMNRVALDSNTFGNNLEINNNVEQVVPIKGAIARASFKSSVGIRALVNITHDGQPVPYASSVIEKNSSSRGLVADEGQAYMTGLPVKGVIETSWGSKAQDKCSVEYDISTMDLTQNVLRFDLECK